MNRRQFLGALGGMAAAAALPAVAAPDQVGVDPASGPDWTAFSLRGAHGLAVGDVVTITPVSGSIEPPLHVIQSVCGDTFTLGKTQAALLAPAPISPTARAVRSHASRVLPAFGSPPEPVRIAHRRGRARGG